MRIHLYENINKPVCLGEHGLYLLQVGHVEILPEHLLDSNLQLLEGDGLVPVVEHRGDLLRAPVDIL